jgi:hypothetical protein
MFIHGPRTDRGCLSIDGECPFIAPKIDLGFSSIALQLADDLTTALQQIEDIYPQSYN